MRKLKLESLTVESFETAAAPRERGTVAAHGDTRVYMCTNTMYVDCSLECTWNTCEGCILLTEYCDAP
jgi:hypothetical protein